MQLSAKELGQEYGLTAQEMNRETCERRFSLKDNLETIALQKRQ